MRAAFFLSLSLLLGLLGGLAGTGCGGPRAPGGSGRLERTAGRPDLLVLEGSPHEMGWWHGRLLRTEILTRVEQARAVEPADYIALLVDQAEHRLSERMLQEVEGMAAATGLSVADLLRPEVAREGLRMKGGVDLAVGAAGLRGPGHDLLVTMRYGGAGAKRLAERALVVHRKPTGRAQSLALGLPGALGAWAAITTDGRGYVLAEVDIRNRRRLGFGGGRPLPIAAREALDAGATTDVETLTAEMTGTMGHTFIAFSVHPMEMPDVRAMGGVQVYTAPDLPWTLGDKPMLAVGPYEDPDAPDAKALQAQAVDEAGLDANERWLRLRAHVPDPEGDEAPTIRFETDQGSVRIRWFAARDRHRELSIPVR